MVRYTQVVDTMNKTQLHDAVESLRTQIDQLDDADAKTRERLQDLLLQMEQELAREDGLADPTMQDTLLQIAEAYEIEHPRVAATVRDIMTKLMSMGI